MSDIPVFRLLCIFPHPDDESFLMGGTIASYALSERAEVSLHTLTSGENSRNAAAQQLRPKEMATIRSDELQRAAAILGIRHLYLDSYPDGGLRDLDPRILERDVAERVRAVRPHVICTFDVQGGSVHPDHITTHHIVKRLFVELREDIPPLQRLCFCVLPRERVHTWPRAIFGAPEERIDAVIDVSAWRETEERALRAHHSVRRDVEENNFDNWMLWEQEYFSFFGEVFQPPVGDLFHGLDPGTA